MSGHVVESDDVRQHAHRLVEGTVPGTKIIIFIGHHSAYSGGFFLLFWPKAKV